MKLSLKVFLIIIITWSLMLAATYFGSQRMLRGSYLRLEHEQATVNVTRTKEAISQMVAALNHLLLTYAVWDDTYQFLIDKNKKYSDGNLSISVLSASDLDMVLYYDFSGKLFYAVATNSDRSKEAPVPPELIQALQPGGSLGRLVENPTVESGDQGLVPIANRILMIAAHSIVTSSGKGPPRGTVIMAKYFTDDKLKQISETTELNLSLYKMIDINHNEELKQLYANLLVKQGTLIQLIDANTIFGFGLLQDINKNSIGVVKVNMSRQVYNAGIDTLRYFNLIFILSGAAFTLLLFYLLNILLIKRLRKINDKIIAVGQTKNFALRVPEESHDELHVVASEMNKMLATIQNYDAENQHLLTKLTVEFDRVNNFSKQLQEAEKFLTNVINSISSVLVIADHQYHIITLNHQAEKEAKMSPEEAKGKLLFAVFPYLQTYENEFHEALENQHTKVVDKIVFSATDANVQYFNAVLYPVVQGKEKLLVVRIDNVTEKIKMEEKLIQNDKLASIGVLTAGVAHEINNPISLVSASTEPLKNNLSSFIELLNQYDEIKSSADLSRMLPKIEKITAEIDITYTIQETEEILERIKEGTARIAEIVRNLKAFSKFDEEYMKYYDIHVGIESTLNLLHYNYKHRINMIKEFGELPKLACFSGKINQIFMNIIANAIESIPDKGEIIIKTERIDHQVRISIKDNGVGISSENKARIFDPFFTTKAVGQGMGLGLSICAAIVEEHHGLIEVKTEIGKGTEFIIILPIEQTHVEKGN